MKLKCNYLTGTFFPLMTDPTKFFGCELGAQTMFDFKNERFIVNGSHDASKLQSLLDGFIKRFVLCPECSNPETQLVSFFQMMNVSFLLVSFKVKVQMLKCLI